MTEMDMRDNDVERTIKRAEREGGSVLITPPPQGGRAASLSALTPDSTGIIRPNSPDATMKGKGPKSSRSCGKDRRDRGDVSDKAVDRGRRHGRMTIMENVDFEREKAIHDINVLLREWPVARLVWMVESLKRLQDPQSPRDATPTGRAADDRGGA